MAPGRAGVHVATTLLGMVDAAIGGKTGVNLPEGQEPRRRVLAAVRRDLRPRRAGDAAATRAPVRRRRDGQVPLPHGRGPRRRCTLTDRVARCVAIKADVVASDEREGGRRALLNYGHTLAHALEIATDHGLTHGEAVGIGLVFAAELARQLDRIDDERVEEHRDVVGGTYGLPTSVPTDLDADELMALMGRDKKALDGLTFVLDGPRGIEVVPRRQHERRSQRLWRGCER